MTANMFNFDEIFDTLLKREGGYVDHPNDRGGPTNMGITQTTLEIYLGRQVTKTEVRVLSKSLAKQIYHQNYWVKPSFYHFEDRGTKFCSMIFDAAVHHGWYRATIFLQQAAGTTADGYIGPQTIKAVDALESRVLASRFMAARTEFIGNIIGKDHSQAVFAIGWFHRVGAYIEMIGEM